MSPIGDTAARAASPVRVHGAAFAPPPGSPTFHAGRPRWCRAHAKEVYVGRVHPPTVYLSCGCAFDLDRDTRPISRP